MKYLKLGEKASMFFDPGTQVMIRNNEVVAFERIPQSKKLSLAIAQGHVLRATEEDYNLFKEGKAPEKVIEIPKPVVDERLDMSAEEWAAYVEKSGFLKKDKSKILAANTRAVAIEIYDQINKTYE